MEDPVEITQTEAKEEVFVQQQYINGKYEYKIVKREGSSTQENKIVFLFDTLEGKLEIQKFFTMCEQNDFSSEAGSCS